MWPTAELRTPRLRLRPDPMSGRLGVFDANDQAIGVCWTKGWVDDDGRVEIAYELRGPHRGKGLGSEAVGALVDWLRYQPDVRAVVAEAHVGNTASRRLLERLGFQPERE